MFGTNKILTLLGLTVIGTVAFYVYNELMKLKNGDFKVLGVKNLNIGTSKVSLTLLTQLTNGGDISATVKDQYYDIMLNGTKISTVNNKSTVKVLSHTNTIIPLVVDIDLSSLKSSLFDNIKNILFDKSKVSLSLVGYFTWGVGILSGKQDFELTYTLAELLALSKQPAVSDSTTT